MKFSLWTGLSALMQFLNAPMLLQLNSRLDCGKRYFVLIKGQELIPVQCKQLAFALLCWYRYKNCFLLRQTYMLCAWTRRRQRFCQIDISSASDFFTADSLKYLSHIVIQYFRRAYNTPDCLLAYLALPASIFCADTFIHTDPDGLPSFADKCSFGNWSKQLAFCCPQPQQKATGQNNLLDLNKKACLDCQLSLADSLSKLSCSQYKQPFTSWVRVQCKQGRLYRQICRGITLVYSFHLLSGLLLSASWNLTEHVLSAGEVDYFWLHNAEVTHRKLLDFGGHVLVPDDFSTWHKMLNLGCAADDKFLKGAQGLCMMHKCSWNTSATAPKRS